MRYGQRSCKVEVAVTRNCMSEVPNVIEREADDIQEVWSTRKVSSLLAKHSPVRQRNEVAERSTGDEAAPYEVTEVLEYGTYYKRPELEFQVEVGGPADVFKWRSVIVEGHKQTIIEVL